MPGMEKPLPAFLVVLHMADVIYDLCTLEMINTPRMKAGRQRLITILA